jgi:GntR family transcriptional regulator/MocR family aminotransferase
MGQFQQPLNGPRGANGAGRTVYDLVRGQIADGTLQAGARAPSTRGLAAELGVSRTTVTAAFEQLVAEGYLVTSAGRAARVARPLVAPVLPPLIPSDHAKPAPRVSNYGTYLQSVPMPTLHKAEPVRFDFLYGALASRDFPTLAWRRVYQAELLQQQKRLYYAAPEGDASLRNALQGYLRRARGLTCDAEQILVVHGAQQGIDLCARLLLNADDAFVFENPGYVMARRSFEATGARCLPTDVDAQGLCTSGLPQDASVRLAYVTPSHQFPLGGVLPITRRQELLQWARQQDAWIVEDDYDGEFRYGQRPIDALQSIDRDGRVIYVGTFSKALSPQLRLGYMVLPRELVTVFQQAKGVTDRHTPVLEQRVLAALIESGAYERHVRRMRRESERRRAALLDAVTRHLPKEAHIAGTAAGLHAVLWLPSRNASEEAGVISAARQAGVGIYPLSPLFLDAKPNPLRRPAGFILGYSSLSVEQIEQGIQTLGKLLSS